MSLTDKVRKLNRAAAVKDLRGAQKMIVQACQSLIEHSETWKEADAIWEALDDLADSIDSEVQS